ncbi:MAG TPA: hypothetical protein VIK18_01340 [Pirellulales bacterium]
MCRPIWQPWRKHLPPPNKEWAEIVRFSRGNAFYHPDIVGYIQELEILCATGGGRLPWNQGIEVVAHEIIRANPRRNMREFWMDCGQLIGASRGRETTLLYAEWDTSPGVNAVHGHPKWVDELRGIVEPELLRGLE